MTSDDNFFFSYLAWVPNDVTKYSNELANSIDSHVERAALSIRETLSQQSWIPASIRPPPPNPKFFSDAFLPPRSTFEKCQDWIAAHRVLAVSALAFVGTGSVLLYGQRKFHVKRRRARRAGTGARKEIVVISGSPHEPMARSIACDLERRGYIVFITTTSTEEQQIIESEGRDDIRSLWFDLSHTPATPSDIHPSLYVIQSMITNAQAPSPGMPPHTCQLSAVILVPSLNYPTGPVAAIPASSWADTINTHLLYPILTTQFLLPLLTLKSNTPSIVFISPAIQSALSAPFASPEVATTHAISGFATSLRQELNLLVSSNGNSSGAIDVIEVKIGNLDLGRQYRSGQRHNNKGTEVLAWQPQQRALYGSPYLSSIDYRLGASGNIAPNSSPVRELHYAIFDAIAPSKKNWFGWREKKPRTVYVGRGSIAYSIISQIIPGGIVGWILGLQPGHPTASAGSTFDEGNASSSETGWERVPGT
ncbi:hypothetical protein McanMca71_003661 [Microsporum canis]|uniref:DUF1776-domain-containing protein n=1 Tax=Arthroderma otae (strain ATCC MYA-4605 / CBS 113480) TaxID=554155 RepID=C5FSS9_ARTOC|nr:conserved hypothetical protein [Microsporum canis CBS 113480]EEQ32932.1 conserved hypothetical protein [Microsporum canis CBS 113480]